MIEKVLEITQIAGSIAKDGFGKKFGVEYKSNELDLVTDVDKLVEKTIIDFIHKNFPGHAILAEESGSDKVNSEFLWVIDPIDGTTNFAHGLPIFSVSIGVQKSGETICGCVLDVMRDAMYSAERGAGTFLNGKRINVNENSKLSTAVLVTGFPYDVKQNPDKVIERFNKFLTNSRAVRRLGSAAIDFCYVAQGVFEGFWEVHLKPWDICAGKLIVEEAGGLVTNFAGEQITIQSKQILASNGKVHSDMMKILSES